jgi:hypothetical protein
LNRLLVPRSRNIFVVTVGHSTFKKLDEVTPRRIESLSHTKIEEVLKAFDTGRYHEKVRIQRELKRRLEWIENQYSKTKNEAILFELGARGSEIWMALEITKSWKNE